MQMPCSAYRPVTHTPTSHQLQEVIEIVAAQLNTRLSPEDRELLEDDVEYFLDHIAPIGKALSTQLSANALHLAKIAHPHGITPPPPRARAPPFITLYKPT